MFCDEPDRARRAVIAVFVLNGALFGAWAARIPAFVERFALTPDRLGLLLLCIAGGAILAFPLAGRFTDSLGAAALTRRLVPCYAATFALVPLAPSSLTLALALAVFGAGYGALDVTMNSWGAEVETALGRPIMSSLHATYSIGAGLGAASGAGAAALDVAPAAHFASVALIGAAATAAIARARWTSPTRSDGPAFARPRGALILVGLAAFASAIAEGAMADWSAIFLVEVAGSGEARAALGFVVFSVAMVAMRLSGDRLTARFGPVVTARASATVAVSGAMLLATGPGYGLGLAGFALLGIGVALIFPLAFSRAAADPVAPPGQAIAAVATLGYGGALLGPPLIGAIAALASLQAGMALIAALALAIVFLAPSLARRV